MYIINIIDEKYCLEDFYVTYKPNETDVPIPFDTTVNNIPGMVLYIFHKCIINNDVDEVYYYIIFRENYLLMHILIYYIH